MGVNHVTTADGEELINLMSDTVDEYSLLEGATAHDASGEQISGKAVYVNPNLLINPDFSVNQRGISGTVTKTGYFLDGWQLVSGSAAINDDGSITLNGTIKQILETPAGDKIVATSSSGTPLYDDLTKTFSLTASSEKITWTKLEPGSVATPFVQSNPAVELAKCQRLFVNLNPNKGDFTRYAVGYAVTSNKVHVVFKLPTPMRISPTVNYSGKLRLLKTTEEVSSIAVTSMTVMAQRFQPLPDTVVVEVSCDGELSPGEAYYITNGLGYSGDSAAYIAFSGELS